MGDHAGPARPQVAEQRGQRVRLERHVGRHPGAGQHVVEDPPVLHVPAEQAEPQAVEVAPADALASAYARDRADQQVALGVERPDPHAVVLPGAGAIEVADPDVELERIEPGRDLARGRRADLDPRARVPLEQRRGQPGDHRQGRRDRADPQRADALAAHPRHVGLEIPVVGDDPPRPAQHPLPLGGQAGIARSAPDDRHAETQLQGPDPGRQRRLGDVTGLRGAAEVPLAVQGHEVHELPLLHHGRRYCLSRRAGVRGRRRATPGRRPWRRAGEDRETDEGTRLRAPSLGPPA